MAIPALGDGEVLADLFEHIDGLFLTGSYSNVEPHRYGGADSRQGTLHDSHRDATTLPLLQRALAANVPLFAVCRGFQEVNVALGGTLHQHVQELAGYADHREDSADSLDVQYGPAHTVHFVEGGMLRRLAGEVSAEVNSLHAQGVARLADGLTVEAVADDGLIEAFSVDAHEGFAIAVQWHPEWRATENPLSRALFAAFGDACREHRLSRSKTGA